MGTRIIKLPDIGEGIAEVELVDWHVKVGDVGAGGPGPGRRDDRQGDGRDPVAGRRQRAGAGRRGRADAGRRLRADPHRGRRARATPKWPRRRAKRRRRPSADDGRHRGAPAAPAASRRRPAAPPAPVSRALAADRRGRAGEKPIASPAVRRARAGAGIDLRQVRGSGPAGRISHDDLDAFLARRRRRPARRRRPRRATPRSRPIKIIGLRRRIAQKMPESKRRIPHFTYVEEVDVTELEALRATLNAENGRTAPRLTLLPFLMQALVLRGRRLPADERALRRRGRDVIERHGGVHIGIATQTPPGLMVPVVRHCEARDLWDCAAEVQRLAEAARNGKATRDELTGSTITITSLGPLGGIVTTPVINQPEVAIIGVNRRSCGPVWQGAQFVPRTMMNLSSSFDHRVIDGYDAAQLHPAHQGPARGAGDDVHGGVRWPTSMPRCWSSAAAPAATSRPSAPASSASTPCWWSRAARRRAGRHLPQRRLHSVEGADPRRRRLRHAVEQRAAAPLGIKVERPTIDFARTIEWKDGIVGRLTGGVGALLKRHRVKIVQGRAEMVDGKTCRVETDTGPQVVRAEHVVLATGSMPAPLPDAAVRRHGHLLDRGAGARRACPSGWPWSAPATSGSSSASPSPSSAPRSR